MLAQGKPDLTRTDLPSRGRATDPAEVGVFVGTPSIRGPVPGHPDLTRAADEREKDMLPRVGDAQSGK